MIYRNDNIKINDDEVKGTIGDLKTYFRYEIASLCMSGSECDYDDFSHNVKDIIRLLDNLYEDTNNDIYNDNDVVVVKKHTMGGFLIESERVESE